MVHVSSTRLFDDPFTRAHEKVWSDRVSSFLGSFDLTL